MQMTVKLLPIFTFLLRNNDYICEGEKKSKMEQISSCEIKVPGESVIFSL